MKNLPPATQAFLAFSRFTRSPVGFAVLTLAATAAIIVVLRGTVDARLTGLIGLVIFGGLAMAAFFWLSLELPILKLREAMIR